MNEHSSVYKGQPAASRKHWDIEMHTKENQDLSDGCMTKHNSQLRGPSQLMPRMSRLRGQLFSQTSLGLGLENSALSLFR